MDVGHGQLHPSLRGDSRVLALEGVNARALGSAELPLARFDLVVGDLAFISLTLVLPALATRLGGNLLLLVKPQFELQSADLGKGGLVRDPSAYTRVEERIRGACAANALQVVNWFESAIQGGDSNQEFFVHARTAAGALGSRARP